jgi:integrase/recombinase XerD
MAFIIADLLGHKCIQTYADTQDMLRAGQYQKVIAIPLKQTSQSLIDYITVDEVKAILQSIDDTTPTGRRDHTLISLLYNSHVWDY